MRRLITCLLTFLSAITNVDSRRVEPLPVNFVAPIAQDYFDPGANSSTAGSVKAVLVIISKKQLYPRQGGSCPNDFSACSNLGAPAACCSKGASCQTDQAGHVACCPDGSFCTGTINVGTQSGPPGPGQGQTTSEPSSSPPTTTTNGFLPPGTSSSPTPPPAGAGGSSVNPQGASPASSIAGFTPSGSITNQYFTFAALPTSFSNAGACSAGYSACQTQYSSCAAKLGGANPVTVSGPAGAGVTVQGGTLSLGTSATKICQSLSSAACHGLVAESCNLFGNAANAAPTPRCGDPIHMGIGMGIALGVAERFLG